MNIVRIKSCAACGELVPRENFSNSQWKKGSKARCFPCVSEKTPVQCNKQIDGSAAAPPPEASLEVTSPPRKKPKINDSDDAADEDDVPIMDLFISEKRDEIQNECHELISNHFKGKRKNPGKGLEMSCSNKSMEFIEILEKKIKQKEESNLYFKRVNQRKRHKVTKDPNDGSKLACLHIPEKEQMTKEDVKNSRSLRMTNATTRLGLKPKDSKGGRYDVHNDVMFKDCDALCVGFKGITGRKDVIIVKHALSPKAIVGLLMVALIHLHVSEGWNQGCGQSSDPDLEAINYLAKHPNHRKGYGIAKAEIIGASISGTGHSGKLIYLNEKGEERSFQLGGFLDRDHTNSNGLEYHCVQAKKLERPEYIPYIEAYYKEMKRVYLKFAPLMVEEATAKALENDPAVVDRMGSATNIISDNNSSIMCHQDNPSVLPALLAGGNPAPEGKREYFGGELHIADGNLTLPYGLGDVVLLNGSLLHSVLDLRPKECARQATRFSHIQFSRQNTEKSKKDGETNGTNPIWDGVPFLRESGL